MSIHRSFLAAIAFTFTFAFSAHAGPKEDIEAAMQARKWEQADELLQESLAKHPKNSLAHYWRAQVMAKLGDLKLAREELDKARRIDPSQKFASNPRVLAELEASLELTAASQAAVIGASQAAVSPPDSFPVQAEAPPVPNRSPDPSTNRGLLIGLVIAIGLLVSAALIYLPGRAKRKELSELRTRARDELDEVKNTLEDAQAWSDGNTTLSPEQKLGNYDRINKLKADVNETIARLPAMTNFDAFDAVAYVVERCKDEAADIRGEEKPSIRKARTAEAAAQRQHEMYMEQAQRRVSPAGTYGNDSSMFTTAVLLNSMGNNAHANTGHRSLFNDSPDDSKRPDFGAGLDLGGSSAGDTSFGSTDTGGSSGGGDTSF